MLNRDPWSLVCHVQRDWRLWRSGVEPHFMCGTKHAHCGTHVSFLPPRHEDRNEQNREVWLQTATFSTFSVAEKCPPNRVCMHPRQVDVARILEVVLAIWPNVRMKCPLRCGVVFLPPQGSTAPRLYLFVNRKRQGGGAYHESRRDSDSSSIGILLPF